MLIQMVVNTEDATKNVRVYESFISTSRDFSVCETEIFAKISNFHRVILYIQDYVKEGTVDS